MQMRPASVRLDRGKLQGLWTSGARGVPLRVERPSKEAELNCEESPSPGWNAGVLSKSTVFQNGRFQTTPGVNAVP